MIINQHIGIFEKAYSTEFCKKHIQIFENELIRDKRNNSTVQDESISLKYSDFNFLEIFWNKHYPKYSEAYPILNTVQRHKIYDVKLQKTKPGEAYHAWHIENTDLHTRNRILAFILYLNTVEEGETEFLDQHLKVKPEEGKLIIWPAYFTHTHKGLPPKQDKYIITGWVEYGI